MDFIFSLHLAVMGWDDLLIAVASPVIGAAVNRAMNGKPQEGSSTSPAQIPQMTDPQDPWSWFASMMSKGGGK